MMMTLGDWNDGRLNDLSRRVDRIDSQLAPVLTIVARQDEKLDNIVKDVHSLNLSVATMHTDIKEMRAEPVRDRRELRKQVLSGVIAALVGGAFVVIAAFASHIS